MDEMAQIEADVLEQYLAEVTAEGFILLEQHTAFVKQMHENGHIDGPALQVIEGLNALLAKELERAHLADADWLVQQAITRADISRIGV